MSDLFSSLQTQTNHERQYLFTAPQIKAALAGQISKRAYIEYLAEAYHHVKHTAPLMRAAKARLSARQAKFKTSFDEYIAEEAGHEEWILDDIRNAGGDDIAVRASEPAPATEFMVAYAYDYINRVNPLGLFGMVYVLEGTSVALAQKGAASVAQSLGLSADCFSYLSSHGALDQEHMNFFEKLMGQVTEPQDQNAILHVAQRMFVLFGNVFRSIPL